MTVGEILKVLENAFPYEFMESWDNCGLLIGHKKYDVSKVLCALDITNEVIEEAINIDAQLIVAHHPVIFTSVSRIISDDATGQKAICLIKNDISCICMHTNADCAYGGVNDCLAETLGLCDIKSMQAGEKAMLGRVGILRDHMNFHEFTKYVKTKLSANTVRFVKATDHVKCVAVGGGSCAKFMDFAIKCGADTFVVGECTYDIMQRAQSLGINLIDAGHFATEDRITNRFVQIISQFAGEIECVKSRVHKDIIHSI